MNSDQERGLVTTFYAVDSDIRPVRTHPVTREEGNQLIADGEATALMSTDFYVLTWATRFDTDARWYIFPRD